MSGNRASASLIKKQDVLLIVILLAVAGALLLWFQLRPAGALVAIVEQNGQVIRRIDLNWLSQAEEVDLGGPYHVQLLAEPGAISFLSSDCPDKTCIRTGKLTRPGQTAVCLPARISVRLESGESTGFDAVTGMARPYRPVA